MVPGVIVEEALRKGLQAIGICDHNAAENVPAVRKAAEKKRIAVLGGMEITSQEEVHVLALFDDDEKLFELQEKVYENLPGLNDEKAFGEQTVVNEKDEVVDVNQRLLIGATTLPLERIVEMIRSLSGLAIALTWNVKLSASSVSWASFRRDCGWTRWSSAGRSPRPTKPGHFCRRCRASLW